MKRRNAILDAALQVLDDEPAETVTVDRLAQIAEVSPATVYNLIGGRDEVLRGVAARLIEHTGAEVQARAEAGYPRVDALWWSRLAIELHSALLGRRSGAYRRLLSYMGSIGSGAMLLKGTNGTTLDAADPHIITMRYAQKKGMIRKNLDPIVLGTLVANTLNGALIRWTYDGFVDDDLSPMCQLGLVSVAASACTPIYRTALEREMSALNRELTKRP